MASYNKVILMGNLTRDPELRFTQANMAICKIGMAVNRRFKKADGEWAEEPTFVDITIFGRRGETFEKYHKKGATAFIEGELRFDTWDDKNTGQKRSKLYVVAENWEFVSGSGDRNSDGGGQRQQQTQQTQQTQTQPAAQGDTVAPTDNPFNPPDENLDDTPF